MASRIIYQSEPVWQSSIFFGGGDVLVNRYRHQRGRSAAWRSQANVGNAARVQGVKYGSPIIKLFHIETMQCITVLIVHLKSNQFCMDAIDIL